MDLVVVEGPNRGAIIALVAGPNTLGRDPDAEVPLLDPGASRRHAEIVPEVDGLRIRDLGSRNGTLVNGVPIRTALLHPSDEVRIGETVLLVTDDASRLSIARGTGGSTVTRPAAGEEGEPLVRASPRCLVGESPAATRVYELIERAAAARATVLVTGESGTGKELVAEAIHRSSPRRRAAFVVVNCASLRGDLLESELFGHEKGAFTGAVARRAGQIEMARGGTLFLDEVGELPGDAQARLLRIADGKPFQRVGGSEPIAADSRLIAATNRDLAAMVREGSFREDLYHRLRVLEIHIPPLRERGEDIPLLAKHFLDELSRDVGGPPRRLTDEALALLARYPWPGNVRELKNTIERILILGGAKDVIEAAHLPEEIRRGAAAPEAAAAGTLRDAERRHILASLEACGGNKSLAAERLGIDRATLYRKLKEFEGGG